MSAKYWWNKHNKVFASDKSWVLYAGETGVFIEITEDERNNIENFIASKEDLNHSLLEKLQNIEVVSDKTTDDFERIRNYRMLKKQLSSVLTIYVCPENKSGIIISEEFLDRLVLFCERKNQKIIRFYWNILDFDKTALLIEKLTKELESKRIIVYNGIITNTLGLSEGELRITKDLRVNNLQFLIHATIFSNKSELIKLLDKCELIFNFFKTNFYTPVITILFEVNDNNIKDIQKLRNYFLQRYGSFFKVDITKETDLFSCQNKISNEVSDEESFLEILKYDNQLNFYERDYLKKVSSCFMCSAQKAQTYIVDWYGNMLKCWNDLGQAEKSVFDLKKMKNINPEVEYFYLTSDSYSNKKCDKCCIKNQCNGGCVHDNKKSCDFTERIENSYKLLKRKQNYFEI